MVEPLPGSGPPLKVLHVLRAPLGGLFRHVLDLAREQIRRGHRVGMIADRTTGGEAADRLLAEIAPRLALGMTRIPMHRNPHPSDAAVFMAVRETIRRTQPHVVHGHGSKGGAYARLSALMPSASETVRAYTPHGGSLNHRPGSLISRVYMQAERLMARQTDLLLFESGFIAGRFREMVGEPPHLFKIVHNGVAESEFVPLAPEADAAEILYVGELRAVKGIDTLLDAIAVAGRRLGTPPRAMLVGSGPDRAKLEDHARRLGLAAHVSFTGPMPARRAFALGRLLVVPSRAESLPYIVLEAAAARLPMIATHVGGIPEIFGPYRDRLLPPDDVGGLADRLVATLTQPLAERAAQARQLADFVHDGFSVDRMVDSVIGAYREALSRKAGRSVPTSSQIAVSSSPGGPS